MLSVFGGIAGIGGMAAMIWMAVHTNQKKHAEENGARMQHTYQQMQTSKGQVRQVDGRTETKYSPGRRKREEEREWNMEEYMMASEGVGETTLLNAAGGETTVLHNAEFAYLLRKDTGERMNSRDRRTGSHDLVVRAHKSEISCRGERSTNAMYIPADADIKRAGTTRGWKDRNQIFTWKKEKRRRERREYGGIYDGK